MVLLQISQEPSMSAWELYLVDWGYNTAAERQRAADNPRIRCVDMRGFSTLLTGARA